MARDFSADGIGRDHIEALEKMAGESLARRGLIVFECPGCRKAVQAPEANPVCPQCGRRATITEDGYAD